MAAHPDLTGNKVHTPFRWVFDNATARTAEAVTALDVGKIAWQMDDDSLWALEAASPVTWRQVGGGNLPLTARGDILTVGEFGNLERVARGTALQVLGWDSGGDALPVDLPASSMLLGGIPTNSAEFTADDTWTAPAALKDGLALVEVQGAGSYGARVTNIGGSGGGSGRYFLGVVPVTPGANYSISVGSEGIFSTSTPAGSSSFGALISCPGGNVGNIYSGAAPPAQASVASSVLPIMSQGEMGHPVVLTPDDSAAGGKGGSTPYGIGGDGASGTGSAPNGQGYGSGGGGGGLFSYDAGDGAPGRVRIWWNE